LDISRHTEFWNQRVTYFRPIWATLNFCISWINLVSPPTGWLDIVSVWGSTPGGKSFINCQKSIYRRYSDHTVQTSAPIFPNVSLGWTSSLNVPSGPRSRRSIAACLRMRGELSGVYAVTIFVSFGKVCNERQLRVEKEPVKYCPEYVGLSISEWRRSFEFKKTEAQIQAELR